ncbi:AMP-binding protein [Solirubrobacter sp. CPCC 204708]|uniref:AMP-binding protein n=1 Tax=Solirubrobacter deserti TaxID=2282478 RepID=A0ABT4RN11_9ACTN|nr:AMP-binding protein [Solirubrobacter deserti]MBE2315035.1 AMP-binding protein [Solirubrobacter deserti]MDA0139950.1 AMP-binding protein [Solirubrobacter deserti]
MNAIETPQGSLTYDELAERASRVRVSAPRVAIAMPPSLDFAIALRACMQAGVEAVPVDLREPVWRVADAGQVITEIDHGRQEKGAGFGLVVHTSGTTGVPRPIRLSLSQIQANSDAVTAVIEPGRWLCPLPLSHIGGLMVLLRSWLTRTTAVIGPADTPDVTVASLVPTQLARLIHQPPPETLRDVMLGGAPADPTLLVRARAAGWPVRPSYGLTQACSAVALADIGDTETSGRPLPGVTIDLAADGEIIVSGASVVGGTHATGDLGSWLDGRLVVHGRKVDTIVSGGENVMPQEVEAVLLSHPAVLEAAVVGRPDPEWGEAVTAFVVLGADAPDLREFVRERLAPFKVPKGIEQVEALPRNAAGKVLRRELA